MSVLHVIDFEGTRDSGITEYGVVTLVGDDITATHTANCAGKFHEHIDMFIKFRREGIFAGHNANVEDRLLRHHMASPGFVKKCSDSDELVSTWGKWIDTMVLYKLFFKNISDYSLENLIDEFELTSKLLTVASNFCPMHKLGYHSAIFDALATCLLLKNLATELKRRSIRTSEMFLLECSNNS